MIQMLASVTNLQEAKIVLEADVDIIDLKNPKLGALGALPIDVVNEVVAFVRRRKTVSATIGDLPMQADIIVDAVELMAATGVDIVKVGFFTTMQDDSNAVDDCVKALKLLTHKGIKLVAVMMADQEPSFELLAKLELAGFYGVMLDTASKNGMSLLDYMVYNDLHSFVELANTMHLKVGLAGSLSINDALNLADLAPDYLGFRGALCHHGFRTNELNENNVFEINALLRKCNKQLYETGIY